MCVIKSFNFLFRLAMHFDYRICGIFSRLLKFVKKPHFYIFYYKNNTMVFLSKKFYVNQSNEQKN